MNPASVILKDICRSNLEQGWAMLETGDFKTARAHFEEAIQQVDQMEAANSAEPEQPQPPTQLTINV
jgi:Tfp pilus assembly protein PilF